MSIGIGDVLNIALLPVAPAVVVGRVIGDAIDGHVDRVVKQKAEVAGNAAGDAAGRAAVRGAIGELGKVVAEIRAHHPIVDALASVAEVFEHTLGRSTLSAALADRLGGR